MDFLNFILKNPRNKRYLLIALGGTILQFIIFKILYPFPDFFSDSYSYIYAAYANLDVSIWPIGYSKFLRWFHFITYSDTALVSFQYFLYQLSALYFFFTILFFFNPRKVNEIILFVFLFFNPLFLYICNYVNSDPLFLSLSMCWFTQLLWIIHHPKWQQILIQAALLFACFTVRNNAYYYPVITILAFAFSRQSWQSKVVGSSLGIAFIIPFVIHTRNIAYKMTGTKQFSLFTGWQLANNALYMYEYSDTSKQFSIADQELDQLSKQFYSMTPKDFRSSYLIPNPGNFFIQYQHSPLKRYMFKHYKIVDEYSNVVAWGKAASVFSEYGTYLIKHNPSAYFWEFVLPNTKNYFIPNLEKLELYNLGEDNVEPIAVYWFHYKRTKINSISKKIQGSILYIFPLLFTLVNLFNIFSLLTLWNKNKFPLNITRYRETFWLITSFLIANFLFCIFVTIIVFRYEIFPMIISLFFLLLLTECLDTIKSNRLSKNNNPIL